MSGSYWKDRFNEKQLERKRLSDKINQRRSRQLSKRNIAELECRLRMLLGGEKATFINRIQQENALLRSKIWRYRSKMGNIFFQAKECLQQDETAWVDFNIKVTTPQTRRILHTQEFSEGFSADPAFHDVGGQDTAQQQRLLFLMKMDTSIFVELAKLIDRAHVTNMQIVPNEILESIMMWKANFGSLDNEFAVLLTFFGLEQEPFNLTTEKVKQQALSKYLFQDIIENILYGEELAPRDLWQEDMIAEDQIPDTQLQRRAVAYCAYETVRTWRKCFKSSLEYLAVFWAQYRYFMIIAFPTRENFDKCPAWRRPISAQFCHAHPGAIDFLLWPKLREKLVSTWQHTDIPDICVSLVQSFEFKGFQADVATLIKLQSHAADVTLDESFERAVHDIRNFVATNPPFANRYPELAEATVAALVLSPSLSDSREDDSRLQAQQGTQRNAHCPLPTHAYSSEDPVHTSSNLLSEHPFDPALNFSTAQLPPEVCTGYDSSFNRSLSLAEFPTLSDDFWLAFNASNGYSDNHGTIPECPDVEGAGWQNSCATTRDLASSLMSNLHSSNGGSNSFEWELASAL